MLRFLKDWSGAITIGDKEYASFNDIPSDFVLTDKVNIVLHPATKVVEVPKVEQTTATSVELNANTQYRVKVKKYMTKPATPDFDFMAKWNNNIPMPLRVMVGEKVKETRGMVYMILHGDILEERTFSCMKCGKPITNPVSQFFGMGPECGGHNYVNPFESETELKEAVEKYRQQLRELVWEGWIIRSAIEELEVM